MTWVIEVEAPGASRVQRDRAVAACWEVFDREGVHPRLAEKAAFEPVDRDACIDAEKGLLAALWHEAVSVAATACWPGVHPAPTTTLLLHEVDDELARQLGDAKGLGME